jgi:hypothetical protein
VMAAIDQDAGADIGAVGHGGGEIIILPRAGEEIAGDVKRAFPSKKSPWPLD